MKNIEQIWVEYKGTSDPELKNTLIENYVGLVKIVAGRMYNYYGSKVEYDDILGYGMLGLIDSIDKFDIDKNIKFETYAQIRIRGEVIDNIRKLDWIPRSLRRKSKSIQEALFNLENELGRKPSNEELAQHLEISVEEVEETLSDISTFNVSSLEETLSVKGDYVADTVNVESMPEAVFIQNELKGLLAKSINQLADNEKKVVSLYYYEELTYKEIGHILELSESRISQIHSKAILKIKNLLAKEGIDKGL